MAILKITASRADLDRIVDGVALNFGYSAIIPDPSDPLGVATIPNPQSKDQFTEAKMIEALRDWAASGEGQPEQKALQHENNRRRNEYKDLDIT